jgi:hypothetical protein
MTRVISAQHRIARLSPVAVVASTLLVVACTGTTTPHQRTTAASPDQLLLSVEEVRALAEFEPLSADGSPVLSEPQPDPMATGACKAVLDQQVIFGTDVDDFRAASYGAATDTGPGQIRGVAIVTQAIGRFPSTESARSAFDRLAPAIEECNQLQVKNYEYDVHNIGGNTLSLHSNVADIVDRVDGATLVHVSVVGLPHSGRIAEDVVQRIGDRIP